MVRENMRSPRAVLHSSNLLRVPTSGWDSAGFDSQARTEWGWSCFPVTQVMLGVFGSILEARLPFNGYR